MRYNKLLKKIEAYAGDLYSEHADERLAFHTFERAREVVNVAEKLSAYYSLDSRTSSIVSAAAWFYYTGFLLQPHGNFIEKSAELAHQFLQNNEAEDEDIILIKDCLFDSVSAGGPTSILGKITADASTFYWGANKFKGYYSLLRKETETLTNEPLTGFEWREQLINRMENHVFYTDYCKLMFGDVKEENLKKLKEKQLEKLDQQMAEGFGHGDPGFGPQTNLQPRSMPGIREVLPVRGTETMFRITSTNNQRISLMADNKAHIMISVNSIIISVVLVLVLGKLEENGFLLIPTLILLTVCISTIIYAILATRPKVNSGRFTPDEVHNKSVNLLFFGSYYNMNYDAYDSAMWKMMTDSTFLYGNLIKNNYQQGLVLGRKYKKLRITYNIFMYGLACSIMAFAIASYLHSG